MAKKGINTTSSPMSWDQFQTLISKMAFDIDNNIDDESKKVQHVKFLMMISIGCYTGMRIGDILQLQWDDLLNKDSYDLVEQKRQKHRTVTINKNLKVLLSKYVGLVKPVLYNDMIFTNKNGTRISIQYVNRHLKELFNKYKIKIKNPSSHSLRKTFGLRVFETNFKTDEALIVLSQVFNHANTQITRRYIGLQDEIIENVYLAI